MGDARDQKQDFLDEFASWLVAQSQQHLEPEVVRHGHLLDLPEAVLYSMAWAVREYQVILFQSEKHLFVNNIIVNQVIPVAEQYIQRFHEKVSGYDSHAEATDQAAIEFQARASVQAVGNAVGDASQLAEPNMSLADETRAFAEHILSTDEEFGTDSFEARMKKSLPSKPDLGSINLLPSFVANITRNAILLHLSKKERPLHLSKKEQPLQGEHAMQ